MTNEQTYDYIVVGGGSAGCVVANRLVTEHGAKVLLLERGGVDKGVLIKWPALVFTVIQNARIKLGNRLPEGKAQP